jgi:hypothetical protein
MPIMLLALASRYNGAWPDSQAHIALFPLSRTPPQALAVDSQTTLS